MSTVIIRKLFETALAAMTPALATDFENVKYVPTDGVPYQAVTVLWAKPENPSFGGFHREVGYFQVDLMYPINEGTINVNARAELIRSAFPNGRTLTQGQISLTVSETPSILPGRPDGDRWMVPVKIAFFANVFE